MSRLVLFKTHYEAQLKSDIQSGFVSGYDRDSFDWDKSQTMPMAFEVDDDICEQMYGDSMHEFEDAVTLYEALKDVPDVMAADTTFWVSLSHTVFFKYLKKRWGKGNLKSTLLSHWFFDNGMMRHGLASLWWSVRLTIDESSDDKYRQTRIVFWNYSFRTCFMGPSIFWRVENVRKGILSYLADHPEQRDGFENKGRYIAMYFNRLGATKQLAALPVSYFYKEMERNATLMEEYNPRFKSEEQQELEELGELD